MKETAEEAIKRGVKVQKIPNGIGVGHVNYRKYVSQGVSNKRKGVNKHIIITPRQKVIKGDRK